MLRTDSIKHRKDVLQSMEGDMREIRENETALRDMIDLVDMNPEKRDIIQRQAALVQQHTADLVSRIDAEREQIAIEEAEMEAEAQERLAAAEAEKMKELTLRNKQFSVAMFSYVQELLLRIKNNRPTSDLKPPVF